MQECRKIDPRIKLLLLPMIGTTGFFIKETILLSVIMLFSFALYFYSGIVKKAWGFLLAFFLLLGLEYGVGAISYHSLVFALYMLIFFLSRMIVIMMFGSYITNTTGVSETLEALRVMRIPRSIGIPFGVLLRFTPTMKNEVKALRESMRTRGVMKGRGMSIIHPLTHTEYTLMPLLMRMMKVADELSASALMRGLDSPRERVTVVELRFRINDVVVTGMGLILVIGLVIVQIY